MIYILAGHDGEHGDSRRWIVAIYTTKEMAQSHKSFLDAAITALREIRKKEKKEIGQLFYPDGLYEAMIKQGVPFPALYIIPIDKKEKYKEIIEKYQIQKEEHIARMKNRYDLYFNQDENLTYNIYETKLFKMPAFPPTESIELY